MRILILHASSDLYGSSKICWLVAQAMKDSGHEVQVVLSEKGPLSDVLENMGIQVLFIRLGVVRRKYLNVKGLVNRVYHILNALLKLRRVVITNKIDLIYTNTAAVITGGLLAKSCGIKSIYHLHEILIPKNGIQQKILGKVINKSADKVVVVSDAVRKNWGNVISKNKLVKIYNGISVKEYEKHHSTLRAELDLSDDKVLLGMIGRVNRFKGQGYLLDIIIELKKITESFHVVFAGDAFPGDETLYAQFEKRIVSEGLSGCVTNLGYRTDVPNIINGLDVFILPSIQPDPFPTVVLEAMAASKPVVATFQGGAKEQVENCITGFHIPLNNPKVAAGIISKLISNSSLRKEMGINGRDRLLSLFSQSAFEKNIQDLIEKI